MRLLIGLTVLLFTIAACKSSTETPKPRTLPKEKIPWADSLVEVYIKYKQNDFIQRTKRDTAVTSWEKYDVIRTDTGTYYEYSLYHSFRQYSETESVCVDSASHRFYKYDKEEDRLIKWP